MGRCSNSLTSHPERGEGRLATVPSPRTLPLIDMTDTHEKTISPNTRPTKIFMAVQTPEAALAVLLARLGTGAPHFGQDAASVLMGAAHSLHLTIAIAFPLPLFAAC